MTQQSKESKTKRRGNNEGSIQPTQNGTWRAWVTLSSGRRISKTHSTKTEARKWLQQKLSEEEQPPQAELTFGEYLLEWFENHSSQIKESTQCDYEIIIHKYILPELRGVVLNTLHRSVFDKYYTNLRKIPVGDTQIRYIHRIIHKALQDAVNDRILSYNPSDGAKAPKKQKLQRINCPLNEEQCDLLLSTTMQNPIGPIIYLALKTGMRQGELFALKWEDINWQNQQIHIKRNMQRVLRGGKQVRDFSTPKTASSNRVIVIGDKTIEVLRFQQREVELKKMLAKKRWRENDLVFPSSIGTPLSQGNFTRQFAMTLKEAGLRHIRFHDLRHIAASIMLNHGIPLLTVSHILGHAQPSTTLNMYGHQFSAMEVQAACLMDDIFFKSQPSSLPAEFLSPSNLKK
ncbi:MAG: site-specific integrase [Anaerolineaceae bacterium]|nr:site-specific integrase [Anaerolineaceae bacterium]